MPHIAPVTHGFVAPEALRSALREALNHDGEGAVCKRLGLSRQSVAKLVGERPVYRGTIALAAIRLGIAVDGI